MFSVLSRVSPLHQQINKGSLTEKVNQQHSSGTSQLIIVTQERRLGVTLQANAKLAVLPEGFSFSCLLILKNLKLISIDYRFRIDVVKLRTAESEAL